LNAESSLEGAIGHFERDIEEKICHSKSTMHDTIGRYRETGTTTPIPRSKRPPNINK